jgi:hypothetical protein
MEGLTMPKVETAPVTVASRELLPIKSTWATVDSKGFRTKDVVIDLPDEISPQDLSDNPGLFRVLQKDRDRALNSLDKITFVWFDKIATATVDYADPEVVVLTKMDIRQRRPRDREPWQDSNFAVRPINGKWSWFRKSDGTQMGGLRDNWEAARADCWQANGVAR